MTQTADLVIIGAGIAGASVAFQLAGQSRVILLEMEQQPGYHTTGRSAAVFAPTYGPDPVRALTRASRAFFNAPPAGFCDLPLLTRRNILMIAREDQRTIYEAMLAEALAEADADGPVQALDAAGLRAHQPLLREGYASLGYLDQSASDIDVGALHQGFLRGFARLGGTLVTKAEVTALRHTKGVWHLTTRAGAFEAGVIVNAAGAWADKIAELAHVAPIALTPKRRTALIVAAPEGVKVDALPLTIDINEEFYLKPDAGRLLISPADETPSAPRDAQPDEMDVAICVDRIETAFDLAIGRIANKWAGLRSFVADKSPVVGFAPECDGFFWLAGQGGYGIQTAPALSRLAAALVEGEDVPDDILAQRFDAGMVAPARLLSKDSSLV